MLDKTKKILKNVRNLKPNLLLILLFFDVSIIISIIIELLNISIYSTIIITIVFNGIIVYYIYYNQDNKKEMIKENEKHKINN